MDISDIVDAIRADRVRVTEHAVEEATADCLSLQDIYTSIGRGLVVETYPHDKPYPSCLISGNTDAGELIHSVWAYNQIN